VTKMKTISHMPIAPDWPSIPHHDAGEPEMQPQNFTRTKLSPTREPLSDAVNCGPISKATCPSSLVRLIEFADTGASIIDHNQNPNSPTSPALRREQSSEEPHSLEPAMATPTDTSAPPSITAPLPHCPLWACPAPGIIMLNPNAPTADFGASSVWSLVCSPADWPSAGCADPIMAMASKMVDNGRRPTGRTVTPPSSP
jgi:hypothetical protein